VSAKCGGDNWFGILPKRKRQDVDAIAKWLSPVRWQWFVTLTFPWNVRSETADKKLKALINAVECYHRAIIGMVAGKESRSRHDGSPVPWHFHLLITSHVSVSREAIQSLWLRLIRRGLQSEADILRRGEWARVEPYDAQRLGPHYCLKNMNEETSDWCFRRLREFLPSIPGAARPNHRTVRRQRRAGEQAAAARRGTTVEGGRSC
jgi:hypothetical protein